jgi:hypothetical protein
MNPFPHLTLTLGAVRLVSSACACDLCNVYHAPLAHGVVEEGFHMAIAEQFTHYGTLQDNGHEIPNPVHQFLDSSVTQIAAGYHFSDRLGVQFNLPIIHRSFRRPEGNAIENGTLWGPGDASLNASYVLFRRDKTDWSVAWRAAAGVKFPTGNSDRLQEEENEVEVPGAPESGIHGHDLALGSGSYDGLVGTDVYTRWRRWFFTAGTQYAIRSEGDFHYQYANDLTWSGGPGYYLIFKEDLTFALQFNISGEWKEKDEFQGEKADDTKITAVYLGPLLSVSWKSRLSAEIGAALPVVLDNSAVQAVPDYRILAGFVWRF